MRRRLVPIGLRPVAAVLLPCTGCLGPLDGRDDNDRTALMRAAEVGDVTEVRRLLAACVDGHRARWSTPTRTCTARGSRRSR